MANWLQTLKDHIGYEGATSLADKLTVARSGYLDNINNANLSTIADISSLSAARIAYLDELDFDLQAAITAIPTVMVGTDGAALVADGWDAALATILDNFTAGRIAYLDELDFDLQTAISAIPTTAMRGTEDAATVADGWDAALATILDNFTAARIGYLDNLSAGAVALEATLTAIKGGGWATETLVTIKAAIDSIAGVNTYMEQIPDTDFALAAIDNALTVDPPTADAENSVVDIDQNAGDTFVLRSLWVNITSFGTAGTTLTFALWVLVNTVVTQVDTVDVTSLGIQSLMDLFGLQEVHADGIWITVLTDSASADAACSGTYRYAKAS